MREHYEPKPYQRIAIDRVAHQACCALFIDPGLGKTSAVLAAFRRLREELEVRRMLVIAPLRVALSVWPGEIEKWDAFEGLEVCVIHGSPAKRFKLIRESKADVFVINPEGVEWLVREGWREWPAETQPDMLVVDESTKFKKVSTDRFKALRKVLSRFPRRVILTGTPSPNGYEDLFGQIYIIDQGKTFGRGIGKFRERYFVPMEMASAGRFFYQWRLRKNADKEIQQAIAPLVLRVEASELPGMPNRVPIDIEVELPKKAIDLYRQLMADGVLALEQGEVTVSEGGGKGTKLRQVAGGSIYLDDMPGSAPQKPDGLAGPPGRQRGYVRIHNAKAKALRDLVEDLGGKPVLVAYEFGHEVEEIRAVMGKDTPVLGYGTSAKKGAEIETQWNRGQLPLLLVHPASAGHGLNLQAGGHVIVWYTPTWNLEHYEQLIRRLQRQGQKEQRVLVYHLIADGTADRTTARGLVKKDASQTDLLAGIRDYLEDL